MTKKSGGCLDCDAVDMKTPSSSVTGLVPVVDSEPRLPGSILQTGATAV